MQSLRHETMLLVLRQYVVCIRGALHVESLTLKYDWFKMDTVKNLHTIHLS